MTILLAEAVLAVVALPVVLCAGYLLLLTLASARPRAPAAPPPRLAFDVVVPAHDEEAGIGSTVESLLAVEWPAELRRVLVVADNCRDATAERARRAGAVVLVRQDPSRRGKGYALKLAFERSLADGVAGAVVVVDADTVVSANLLAAFAARLERGARAAQALYGVRNPDASWRTRLMAVAFATTGTLRALGRERLGCSVGLRGNGMCFASSLLREVPHEAFSIVEDAEHAIRLARAGVRVHLAGEAEVRGEMVSGAEGSASQRRRWEDGRRQLRRQHALPLIREGLRRGDRVLLEMGIDLLVPPLAQLAAAAALGTAAAAGAAAILGGPAVATWIWAAALAAVVVHVARGWVLSGTGLRGLSALLHAPVYLVWKIGLKLGGRRPASEEWIRTQREAGEKTDLQG